MSKPSSICSTLNIPDEFESYGTQVAGHMLLDAAMVYDLITPEQLAANIGILRHKPTGHLLKAAQSMPRGEREICFYEMCFLRRSLTDADTNEEEEKNTTVNGVRINPEEPFASLAPLIPTFYGTRAVPIKEFAISFLELEDVTAKFTEANILDVKIGWRTWDPTASQEKILKSKAKYPLGQKLGFRFLGMNVYDRKSGTRHKRDKIWGRSVKETEILNVFNEFLCAPCLDVTYRHSVLTSLLSRMHDVLSVFSKQTALVFYSTSLLLVYEGKPPQTGITPDHLADVRMIDFTHVHRQRTEQELDKNYLKGLKSLMQYATQLRDDLLQQDMQQNNSSPAVKKAKLIAPLPQPQ